MAVSDSWAEVGEARAGGDREGSLDSEGRMDGCAAEVDGRRDDCCCCLYRSLARWRRDTRAHKANSQPVQRRVECVWCAVYVGRLTVSMSLSLSFLLLPPLVPGRGVSFSD